MARKLRKPGFVTAAQFARRLGVSPAAVSLAMSGGRLQAFDGDGQRVPTNYPGRKWLDPGLAAADWRNRRLRVDDDGRASDELVAAKVRMANAHAELMEMRLGRESGELILRSDVLAADEALGRAIKGAYMSIVGWNEELYGAAQAGSLAAFSGLLRAKAIEFGNTLADLIMADAAKYEPPDRGGPE